MNRKLHLAFFMPNLSFGGVQSMVFFLARDFQKKGYKVTIFGFGIYEDQFLDFLTKNELNYEKLDEINFIHSKEFKQLSRFRRPLKHYTVLKGLRRFNIDAIFSFTSANTKISYWWKATGAKMFMYHDVGGHPELVDMTQYKSTVALKKTKPVYVVNSFHCQESFSKMYKVPKEKVFVVQNGTELSEPEFSRGYWRDRLKVEDDEVLVLMMANFFNEKDHLTVIKAFDLLLQETNKKIKLAFTGIKIRNQEQNWEKAISYVDKQQLQKKVMFLEHIDDKDGLQSAMDIGVLSSVSEGRPNYVMEVMLHGKAFVGTKIPGIQEIVGASNDKFLFEVGNVKECSKRLKELCESDELRVKTGEENRKIAKELFSIELMVEKYEELIKNKFAK